MFGFAVLPTQEGDLIIATAGLNYHAGSSRRRNSDRVFSSLDGITWVARTDDAEFGPRKGHATIVMGTRLFVIGGHMASAQQPNSFDHAGYMDDIWRSDDIGVTWSEQTDDVDFGGRNRFGCVSDGLTTAIVVGGQTSGGGGGSIGKNDVWVSEDRVVTWTRQTNAAPFGTRQEVQVAILGSELIIAGGHDGSTV